MENNNAKGILIEKVIEELVRGREWACKLQLGMLRRSSNTSSSSSSSATHDSADDDDHHHHNLHDLVAKILGSFTQTLNSLLNPAVGDQADDVSNQVPPIRATNSQPPQQAASSELVLSCKPSAASKDRRGCYKRRRRTSETWSRESPALVDDGHAWRKYGQKVILNAQYPRNYFRCTHKFDQGCQATKQVQKIQEDPPVFRTTYHGRHTCKINLMLHYYQVPPPHQEIIDDHLDHATTINPTNTTTTTRDPSILLSFESTQVPSMILRSNESSSGLFPRPALVKQLQMNEEEVLNHTSTSTTTTTTTLFEDQPSASSSSSDHHQFLSHHHHEDFTAFESMSGPLTAALSSDYGDVISSGVYSSSTTATSTTTTTSTTTHTHNLEMDHMDTVVNEFDDFSQFEFDT